MKIFQKRTILKSLILCVETNDEILVRMPRLSEICYYQYECHNKYNVYGR